jgi:hypothetical protein
MTDDKEERRCLQPLTKEQWLDLVDACLYGLSSAGARWVQEGRVANGKEAVKKAQLIIDLVHSDWWFDGGGSECVPKHTDEEYEAMRKRFVEMEKIWQAAEARIKELEAELKEQHYEEYGRGDR